jgi:hypothetical protein
LSEKPAFRTNDRRNGAASLSRRAINPLCAQQCWIDPRKSPSVGRFPWCATSTDANRPMCSSRKAILQRGIGNGIPGGWNQMQGPFDLPRSLRRTGSVCVAALAVLSRRTGGNLPDFVLALRDGGGTPGFAAVYPGACSKMIPVMPVEVGAFTAPLRGATLHWVAYPAFRCASCWAIFVRSLREQEARRPRLTGVRSQRRSSRFSCPVVSPTIMSDYCRPLPTGARSPASTPCGSRKPGVHALREQEARHAFSTEARRWSLSPDGVDG